MLSIVQRNIEPAHRISVTRMDFEMNSPFSRSQHGSIPYFDLDWPSRRSSPSGKIALAAIAGALAATAILNRYLANKAEREIRQPGSFWK